MEKEKSMKKTMEKACTLVINRSWQRQSNGFVRSFNHAQNTLFLSVASENEDH